VTAALTKLESAHYYQGWKVANDYIDKFPELMNEARYTVSLSIVVKFRKGLDQDIQDQIAEMVQGILSDDDPKGWYSVAHIFDANWAANQAFHGVSAVANSTCSNNSTALSNIEGCLSNTAHPLTKGHSTLEYQHGHPTSLPQWM
jgi:hypothetical protein